MTSLAISFINEIKKSSREKLMHDIVRGKRLQGADCFAFKNLDTHHRSYSGSSVCLSVGGGGFVAPVHVAHRRRRRRPSRYYSSSQATSGGGGCGGGGGDGTRTVALAPGFLQTASRDGERPTSARTDAEGRTPFTKAGGVAVIIFCIQIGDGD